MIKSVIKRDGRVVLFDEGKIAAAVLKALEAATGEALGPALVRLGGSYLVLAPWRGHEAVALVEPGKASRAKEAEKREEVAR